MFCPKCGTQCADNAQFCAACGNRLSAPAAPAATPVPAAPATAFSVNSLMDQLKQYKHILIITLAVIAFVLALFNFGGQFDITATVSYNGNSESSSGSVADVIESGEYPLIFIGNLLFGLANLVIAAVATLLFLKEFKNLPYYDNFVAKVIKLSPLFLMGVVGAGAALLQILFYAFSGESETFFGQTIRMSFGANWTTWVFMFVYAGLAVLDKLVLNKKEKPAAVVDAPAAE